MNIRGFDLNVRVAGEGVPFVWAHGLLGNMWVENEFGLFGWDRLADVCQLIRYDARGHGASEPSFKAEDYTWHSLAADMLAIAEASGVKRFIAGGQSRGCATSIHAALSAPERIRALVLVNPPTAWEARARQTRLYTILALGAGVMGSSAIARTIQKHPERALPGWLVESEGFDVGVFVDGIKALKRRTLWNLIHGAAKSNLPAPEVLEKLTLPTLILAWEGDQSHPLSVAETIHRRIPGSRLEVARRREDLEGWPEMLREFITELSGPQGAPQQ